jgi:7 transmembrane receptor (rhodopsin family)
MLAESDRKRSKLVGSLTSSSEPNYWCLLLLVFPVLTVFGNVLVCLSVYNEKALHTVTNYFIVSLAIADIMVAILVMPLAVYVEVSDRESVQSLHARHEVCIDSLEFS